MKRKVKWLIPCLVACFMVVGLVQTASYTFATTEEVQTEETTDELNTDESSEFSNEDANSFDPDLNGDESLSEETMSNYKIFDEGATYATEIDKGDIYLNVGDTKNLGNIFISYGKWTSDNYEIVTVDQYGKIEGISSSNGHPVQVKHSYKGINGRRYVEIYYVYVNEQTVTYKESAEFYYLKTPTSDPVSNDTSQWGAKLGEGKIDTKDIVWTNNRNCFIPTTPKRVVEWPDDLGEQNEDGSYTLYRNTNDNSHWMAIFNAYKESVSKDLKLDITTEDIECIILHPYKISKNNGTNPDKHVDCTVEIKVKGIVTASFYVMEPGSTSYEWKEASNYKLGADNTVTVNGPKETYEAEKEYNGIKYVFDGWYKDETCTEENKVTFGTQISENTNFYARYVPKTVTINYVALANGSVSNSTETVNVTGSVTGSTATPNTNYKFVGWYSDQNCTEASLVSTKATLDDSELVKINQVNGEWQEATYYARFERIVQDITVKKDVSGDYGNHNETFNFSYSYMDGNDEITGTFTLKDLDDKGRDDEGFKISNIPIGTQLTITESNVAGYETTATYTGQNADSAITANVVGDKDDDSKSITVTVDNNHNLITITNTKNSIPLTGITDNTPKGLGLIGSIVVEIAAIAFVLKKKRQLKM